jgi:hypothetical protein
LNGYIRPPGPGISPDYNRLFSARQFSTSAVASSNPNVTVTLSGNTAASAMGSSGAKGTVGVTGYTVSAGPGVINYGSSQSQSYGIQGQTVNAASGVLAAQPSLVLTGSVGVMVAGQMVYSLVLTGASMTATAGVIVAQDFSFNPQDVVSLQSNSASYT